MLIHKPQICGKRLAMGAFLGLSGVLQAAVFLGSLDAFDTGLEGWQVGQPGTPARSSGPGFDSQPGHLTHFSDGDSAFGKWLMWTDDTDWQGNYITAGVTAISLWADNRGPSPFGMRIAFDGPGGWFYSTAQTIFNTTGGDDWMQLTYVLDSANFTYVPGSGGTTVFSDTISAVSRFEMLGGPNTPAFRPAGDIIEAGESISTIAIDHIRAIPEPGAFGLAAATVFVALVARRRGRRN